MVKVMVPFDVDGNAHCIDVSSDGSIHGIIVSTILTRTVATTRVTTMVVMTAYSYTLRL